MFKAPQMNFKHSIPRKRNKSYKVATEEYPFNTHNGYCIFSYKGIVVERKSNIYTVARQIKIKGFPEASLMHLSGSFTSGEVMKGFIDYALDFVDTERHQTVRKQYKNWKCSKCGTHALYDPSHAFKVYLYTKNEWGEEIQHDTGKRKIQCFYCDYRTPLEELEWAGDEVML